jgi:hypothetical protein
MMRNFILGFLVAVLLFASGILRAAPAVLEWDPEPGAESYEVWVGEELAAIVTAPSVILDLPTDRVVTLRVRATNIHGESPLSSPLAVHAVTMQATEDLQTWTDVAIEFVEWRARQFFRVAFPTIAPEQAAASDLQE